MQTLEKTPQEKRTHVSVFSLLTAFSYTYMTSHEYTTKSVLLLLLLCCDFLLLFLIEKKLNTRTLCRNGWGARSSCKESLKTDFKRPEVMRTLKQGGKVPSTISIYVVF